jgi:hypothetical protein
MAGWRDWLQKQLAAYSAGDQESESLGRELAARGEMQRQAQSALSPAQPVPVAPAPVQTSPADLVNPGYGQITRPSVILPYGARRGGARSQ